VAGRPDRAVARRHLSAIARSLSASRGRYPDGAQVVAQMSGSPAAEVTGESADPPVRGKRRGWGRWLRYGFVVAVIAAVALLLYRQRDEVAAALSAVSPGAIVLSLVIGTIGVWLPGLVWRDLLASQGYPT